MQIGFVGLGTVDGNRVHPIRRDADHGPLLAAPRDQFRGHAVKTAAGQ